MKTLFCHPANMEILKRRLTPVSRIDPRIPASIESTWGPLDGIKCITDLSMERTRKTGQYVLPGGKAVPEDQVRFGDRFCEYSPEDIELALFMGWIEEEETLVYFLMEEPKYWASAFVPYDDIIPVTESPTYRTSVVSRWGM